MFSMKAWIKSKTTDQKTPHSVKLFLHSLQAERQGAGGPFLRTRFSGAKIPHNDVELAADFRLKRDLLSIRGTTWCFGHFKTSSHEAITIGRVMVNASFKRVSARFPLLAERLVELNCQNLAKTHFFRCRADSGVT